jgi:hypothetical protein
MKEGDMVRYKTLSDVRFKIGAYPSQDELWVEQGLLVQFDKIQRTCAILDNKTLKIIRKHCRDVQLIEVGYANR